MHLHQLPSSSGLTEKRTSVDDDFTCNIGPGEDRVSSSGDSLESEPPLKRFSTGIGNTSHDLTDVRDEDRRARDTARNDGESIDKCLLPDSTQARGDYVSSSDMFLYSGQQHVAPALPAFSGHYVTPHPVIASGQYNGLSYAYSHAYGQTHANNSADYQFHSVPGKAQVYLCNRALWFKFHRHQTEMIVTKQGR